MSVADFFKKLLFARALVFDKGALKVLNVRSIIIPGETFVRQQYEMLKKNPKNDSILKEIGIMQGKSAVELAKKFYQGGTKDKVDNMLQSIGFMGFGEVRLVNPDISTGNAKIQLTNSLVATEYKRLGFKTKKPVDTFMLGVIEGGISDLIGKKVVCKETKCEALGAPYCEIESKPVK